LRAQQILAFETDLLCYDDIFDGSAVIERRVSAMVEQASREIDDVLARGGVIDAVESGYIKQRLVESNAARIAAIERGDQIVVGVNRYRESAESPLTKDLESAILTVDPAVERQAVEALARFRAQRDRGAVATAIERLRSAVQQGQNIMPPSIEAAKAGVTTGEWAAALREVLGEYRAPTGVAGARIADGGQDGASFPHVQQLRAELARLEKRLGRRPKILVGKPGLDGHSNGAEQIALKARDVGFEVVYEGIRVSPERLVASALEEGVHIIGISILSGSHLDLVPQIIERARAAGLGDIPIVVGGIIPEADAKRLEQAGVARVYTPKDFELDSIMDDLVRLVAKGAEATHAAN
jgi:(2R)-ethylmalonyl-CoA mutase